jgi:hypothetical protein
VRSANYQEIHLQSISFFNSNLTPTLNCVSGLPA